MIIRKAVAADNGFIKEVHEGAFNQSNEADLVESLRMNGDEAISLVAEMNKKIVGHIYYSELKSPALSLSLAPISVLPDFQNQGIGGALIKAGHDLAASMEYNSIFVLGDPAYYTKFGFDVAAAEPYSCEYAGPYFMVQHLKSNILSSNDKVIYASAFNDLS